MTSVSNRHRLAAAFAIFCGGLLAAHVAWTQASAATPNSASQRATVVFSKELPALDGAHLKATLVQVHYGPGEASLPHSHPCVVIGYVTEGAIRFQVKGEPQAVYKAGETFYEAPDGVHLVSANASAAEPAQFLAYFVCDHDAPLSTPIAQRENTKDPSR